MMYFLGAVLLTSWLTLVFKFLEKYKISILQTIIINYFVCIVTGNLFNGKLAFNNQNFSEPWFIYSLILGFLFIFTFNIIGRCAQINGVAVTTVSNKLSLIIPFVFSIFALGSDYKIINIIGVLLALVSVWLINYNTNEKTKFNFTLPAIVFIGSGIIDSIIVYINSSIINNNNRNIYLIHCFSFAFIFGLVYLLYTLIVQKQKFDVRSIVYGIVLGIPNYFSIWCLFKTIEAFPNLKASILPAVNIGIVIASTLLALLLFKEKLKAINYLGILLAITAIACIALF